MHLSYNLLSKFFLSFCSSFFGVGSFIVNVATVIAKQETTNGDCSSFIANSHTILSISWSVLSIYVARLIILSILLNI